MRQYRLEFDGKTSSDAPLEDASQILNGLNEVQQQAASTTEGPVMIVAGPGSGKTRTLTHRIAYLIATRKAWPNQILALTFTNKAAREMKERIEDLVGEEKARGMWMGTFHSTFARMMRVEAEALGYTRDFSIYDVDDGERVIKNVMRQLNIDTKQFSPRSIRNLISSAKNQMVEPEQYKRMVATAAQEQAARVYGRYEGILRNANAMDFDDLLIKPIELFTKHKEILEKYQQRWKYIHIDEYQDTNHAQYRLTKLLAAGHKNICVVGDDAQSIYAFRGADIANILSFKQDYPQAKTIRLEQSYRSTKRILKLADSIIGHNKDQLEKSLWTENAEGEEIMLVEAISEKDEAQKVERRIRDIEVRTAYRYEDFAILYRTNAQSRSFEDALRRSNIPYRVIGGMSFYQRREIKDVLAYLRLLVNPNDIASLRRVINYPTRGIGSKTQEQLFNYAGQSGLPLWDAVRSLEQSGLTARSQTMVGKFVALIEQYRSELDTRPADELTRDLVKDAGIFSDLRDEGTQEGLVRWENVQELINAIAEFRTQEGGDGALSTFLQQVSLFTDQDEDKGAGERVTMMTLHASKGLEFAVVFIAGLEEGLFPLASASQDRKDLEEERRLFYVGVTRAKAHLFLSNARSRFRYGEHSASVRSRFLEEVDSSVLRTEAGEAFHQKKDRFKLKKGRTVSYDNLDPNYFRQSLTQSKKKRKIVTQTTQVPDGRRVVYDEGEGGQIVPGAIVEHDKFGQGKVLSMEGQGQNAKAIVYFQDIGQKKLALRFAKLRLVG
ncbi:MAG: UvrD-helicase domain-containing protein [Rhodothermaceae bacterium]|nr:UvrD-helicase domain-containing protein [Rhodothermaceae bacterium]